ncbi:MAG TPA: response regulator [Candidatus Omnitrophota bacterium]|nr:response regulator [Candidatus Omnitrophota bacterium]
MAKILVADDEEDVGIIVAERLRDGGHQVEWVPDGTTALAKIEEGGFDLAILDIRMPGADGYVVCASIKNSPKWGKIPVLLMSAFEKEQKNWQKSKADAFLAKPFETNRLVGAVEKLLRLNGAKS